MLFSLFRRIICLNKNSLVCYLSIKGLSSISKMV